MDNPQARLRDRSAYEQAADDFAEAMKSKLRLKGRQGFSGWDSEAFTGSQGFNPSLCEAKMMEHMAIAIKRSRDQAPWVDVANYAMFMWHSAIKEE